MAVPAASADEEARPPGGTRHAARKRALDILYEADLKERPLSEVLAAHLRENDNLQPYAVEIVRGVHRNREQIDGLIEAHARGWKLSRMPIVDRNVLRVGLFEMLHNPEVPTAVAIDEAVELAKELSTEDSGRFVNGLLARAAQDAITPSD
jgi:N utilization substance protein B